ncbi:MAG: hypothetical protein IKT89_00025 [Clostridia bacterium]|nr:hypothetical protein [Clostridia bacterium]
MKDEKEINTSTEKSNEELEAALDKTEEYAEEELHDELEKLAATFRNELNKAKEQGAVKIGEVAVVDEHNNVIPKEELCECCGERRKDTTISASYQYCSECRERMKRYPISLVSVFIAVVVTVIAIAGVGGFITDFSGYNSVRSAEKAYNENKKFSAVEYYDKAIAFFDEQDVVAKKLYKDSASAVFDTLPSGVASFNEVAERLEKSVTEFEAKLPIYKSYKDLRDKALIMYNTFTAFYTTLNNVEYGTFDEDDKETITKVYNDIGALADKEFTIDSMTGGDDETVTYDKASVLFSQFMFAYAYSDFDGAYEAIKALWENYPEYIQMYGYEFAVIEIQSGNYKNALKLAEAVKANNAEDSSPYVVYAYCERMKGNFDKAIKYSDEGVKLDSQNPDLYRQKGIALMLKGDYSGAKKEFETGLSISEYGVLYYTYLVALNELGDTKTFEEVQSVLDNAGLTAPEKIQNYLDGKITVKEIFMEGTGDIE